MTELHNTTAATPGAASSPSTNPWLDRARAAGAHLLISGAVALLVAMLVFNVWYPSPYRDMVGGRELFMLVMGVDIVMGPALTFVAFNRTKGFKHLARDLAIIGFMQLGALGYGLNTVFLARPVHINFEIDRLRVLTAADIDPESVKDAPESLRNLPITGPMMIASVKPTDPKQQERSVELAMAGFDLSQQPITWQAMDKSNAERLWNKATPVDALRKKLALRKNADAQKLEDLVKTVKLSVEASLPDEDFRFIPMTSKRVIWTAMIDRKGKVWNAAPIDMFD
jgi:hypothetical protein